MRSAIAILPLLLLCLPALAREITLTVRNHAGVTLAAQPVRGGVPFALGELKEPPAQLLDETGKALPCQARATAHWYDGSIKWLLVDTQVSLQPGQERKLRLVTGAGGTPALQQGAVKVEERPDQIVVDTGSARFVFSRRPSAAPRRCGWT